jgi:hypothetical protein
LLVHVHRQANVSFFFVLLSCINIGFV